MNINGKTTSVQGVDRLQEISRSLNSIVSELAEVNYDLKKLEDAKASLRKRFFELVDEHISLSGIMETQVVSVKCASRAEANLFIEENYPGWRIIQYEPDQIVIEEDPSQMKFEWMTDDGYQIGRTTAIVGTKFDYEYLRENSPQLYNEIVETKTVYELNEKKAQKILEENPEYLPVLQNSTKLGKIQLRMSSPKKVNEE